MVQRATECQVIILDGVQDCCCTHLTIVGTCDNHGQFVTHVGAPGGTTLNSASIVCQGPAVPVPILGSAALAAYSNTFQGVAFTQDVDPDGKVRCQLRRHCSVTTV